jgi:hypothetical protein
MPTRHIQTFKAAAVVVAVLAYFPVLFVCLGFLAQDVCLDRGGALVGAWYACEDAAGHNWTWLGLLNPQAITIIAAVIGLSLAIAVRKVWRLLDAHKSTG